MEASGKCYKRLFESEEKKQARQIAAMDEASRQEQVWTAQYLRGELSSDDYRALCQTTYTLTKLDLRKLAADLHR